LASGLFDVGRVSDFVPVQGRLIDSLGRIADKPAIQKKSLPEAEKA
jgi:hypothetical protein